MHYQVTQVAGGKDCIVFFTKKSESKSFLKYFRDSGCSIRDISKYTDTKWLYFLNFFWRGIVTGYINRQKLRPVVFNGQCNFGYKISPWIKKEIHQIELIHSFNSFSYIRTPFLPFISETVMISKKRIEDHIKFYDRINVPIKYIEKIRYIPNAIILPDVSVARKQAGFTVLYVGRGGKEKRVHLIAAIAKIVVALEKSIKFEILGDVSGRIKEADHPYIKFHGNLDDDKMIRKIYLSATVLLLTSETEGFPMVVIEAMASGCVIMGTAVGDLPMHIKEGINGYLFTNVADEEKIIREGTEKILALKNDPQLVQSISMHNISYAKHNFAIEKFNASYRQLLELAK